MLRDPALSFTPKKTVHDEPSFSCRLASARVVSTACLTQTQVLSPEKEERNPGVGVRNPPSLETNVDRSSSFEYAYFTKAHFLGEFQLSNVLFSLLSLYDCCSLEQNGGLYYLVDSKRLMKKIKEAGRMSEYRKQKVDLTPLAFCVKHSIRLDSITQEFPVAFCNPELLFHALKFSFALYTTIKIFRLENRLKVPQRTRRGKFVSQVRNLLPCLFGHVYFRLKSAKNIVGVVKLMKTSLCNLVSEVLENERLQDDSFFPFPLCIWSQIQKHLGVEKIVEFAYSCLQSKSLCKEVDETFVLETLVKHRKQIQDDSIVISDITLQRLRNRGREFGKLVKKYYRPEKGYNPTPKATFSFTQPNGGVKGDLIYHDRLRDKTFVEDPEDRAEPLVVALFGQPGQGKSTRLSWMVSALSSFFPSVRYNDLVYTKSCHVEHWDGYRCQPIVIYDDFGQSTKPDDIREFQTLVSCAPYVVPMADLKEKGTKFSSPIIILTSNLNYLCDLKNVYGVENPIITDSSFWRRIHYPIQCEGGRIARSKVHIEFFDSHRRELDFCRLDRIDMGIHNLRKQNFERHLGSYRSRVWQECTLEDIFQDLKNLWRFRRQFHQNHASYWKQDVSPEIHNTQDIFGTLFKSVNEDISEIGLPYLEGASLEKELNFPAYPPPSPLKVRVEPILEPLKVRTITAGEGDTFCLKPFQVAMWKALGDEPQFVLTHGTNNLKPAVKRIYQGASEGSSWISGDYSAATDTIPLAATRAVLEGILESIDHQPTKRWALKEISPHLVFYPKTSGLLPCLQKSGQLMGSLLSFPILCLINDCTARYSGLKPTEYLINGDDILMRCSSSIYPTWKERASEFGFVLSPGKNYIHPRFGTVNSQLIKDDVVLFSGKQKVLERRSKHLGQCLRDWELFREEEDPLIAKKLFVLYNAKKLKETCRSVSIPSSHGGLGFHWSREISNRDHASGKICYVSDLFDRIRPLKEHISIPFLANGNETNQRIVEDCRIFNDPCPRDEAPERFLHRETLNEVSKRIKGNETLREVIHKRDLWDLPSLTFVETNQIPFKGSVKERRILQAVIDHQFFRRFLLKNHEDFGYSVFAQEYRQLLDGLEVSGRNKILLDLRDIPFDLKHLNLYPRLPPFSREEFQKKFFAEGASFKPKVYEVPEIGNVTDFVHDLYQEEVSKLNLDPEMEALIEMMSTSDLDLSWALKPSWDSTLFDLPVLTAKSMPQVEENT